MAVLNQVHGGNIYEIQRVCKKKVIDFSANINPLNLPGEVKRLIRTNIRAVLHYPDPDSEKLSRSIAAFWNVEKENILVGNGSIELIYLIMHAFSPRTVSIPVPSFSEYEVAAKWKKSKIRFVPLKEKERFRLYVSRLPKADILFVCNPNNPTGNLIAERDNLIAQAPNKLVVIDEAFMDFLSDERKHTSIRAAVKNRKIIVLRSFTKFFALPGLRLGYVLAHRQIIDKLKRWQPPWSVNALAQIAGKAILADKKYIRTTRRFIEKERDFFFGQLSKIKKLEPYPSVTNFLLVKIQAQNITSSFLLKKLIKKGILIRDCVNFKGLGNKFIRLAVRSHKDNLKFLRALKEVM